MQIILNTSNQITHSRNDFSNLIEFRLRRLACERKFLTKLGIPVNTNKNDNYVSICFEILQLQTYHFV
jgi:hypothetical protein